MGITLFKRKLAGGRYSLYLNIYHNGKRRKEAMGLTLQAGTDRLTRKANREIMNMAKSILLKRQLEYLKYKIFGKQIQIGNMTVTQDKETNLIKLFREYLKKYTKKDNRLVEASLTQLEKFASSGILYPEQVNKNFCQGFLEYLYNNFNGNTPAHYFKKFKQFLSYCTEEGYIAVNPAQNIHPIQQEAITKNILTAEEIIKLARTPCTNKEVKRAFLFSCNSGLRWCDIKEVRYNNIDIARRSLTITQKKVSTHSGKATIHLNLNNNAIRIIGTPPINTNKTLFNLPTHPNALKIIKQWTKAAGIRKHISFHCARHTFITLIMTNGADIKTAASLAGHSSTRHTEKYIHIIDKQKQKAVDSLPELPPDTSFFCRFQNEVQRFGL